VNCSYKFLLFYFLLDTVFPVCLSISFSRLQSRAGGALRRLASQRRALPGRRKCSEWRVLAERFPSPSPATGPAASGAARPPRCARIAPTHRTFPLFVRAKPFLFSLFFSPTLACIRHSQWRVRVSSSLSRSVWRRAASPPDCLWPDGRWARTEQSPAARRPGRPSCSTSRARPSAAEHRASLFFFSSVFVFTREKNRRPSLVRSRPSPHGTHTPFPVQ
jgi:hypothetical protein